MDKQWHENNREWTMAKEVQALSTVLIYIHERISNRNITVVLRRKANESSNPWTNI